METAKAYPRIVNGLAETWKVLSIGLIRLLNALGYLVSIIAIRRGFSQDVLT